MILLRMFAALAVAFTIPAVASAAPPPAHPAATGLPARIHALIIQSPVAAKAYWGIEIADASTGLPIYKANAENFFVPASNTKLFSTALTLCRLGAKFTIETTVNSSQPADPDGVLTADLVLKGAGDPSLKTADLESLAAQLFERGIRRVNGSVIGDDTAFLWEPYNPGWSIDDAVEGYGAPISALTLNDNIITLHIRPGLGGPGQVSFEPPVPLFMVENQLEQNNLEPERVHYERLPGSPALRIWGRLHDNTRDPEIMLGVDDPARYAALTLLDALQRKGIQVTGKAEARHRQAGQKFEAAEPAIILARHQSPPLIEDLRVTDKTSQNLHAETYLRLVAGPGAVGGAEGGASRKGGLMALKSFLDDVGLDQKEYSLQDGSGLSRLNVVSPHAIVTLLVYMAKSVNGEDWTTMLPVGGTDGTLENRMKSKRLKGRVIAKTGSLSHVSALSGYVNRSGGKRYAFSILVNNYNGPSSDIRDVIDKICSLLVD